MKKRILLTVFILAFVCPVFDCPGFSQEKPVKSEIFEPYDWPVSTPEEQGIDPAILEIAFREAERMPYIDSLLIARNGYLIAERYYNEFDKNTGHELKSVTKSFTSALIGIAIREKFIESIEQKMMDFFPDYTPPPSHHEKYNITIKHLLTMTSGIPENNNYFVWFPDFIKYALEFEPLVFSPGKNYEYTNIGAHLLAEILTRATGMSTKEFAETYLFNHLKISERGWERSPMGVYMGDSGLLLTPRDMLRFGQLYLQNGYIDGQQLVPPEWVAESSQYHYPRVYEIQLDVRQDLGYGYLWWISKVSGYSVYNADGFGGQKIWIIPGLNMTVVQTARWYGDSTRAARNSFGINNLLGFFILAPIREKNGVPPYSPSGAHAVQIENRSLFMSQFFDKLNWQPNPLNSDVNITGYRIYRFITSDALTIGWQKTLLAEVDSSTFQYMRRQGDLETKYEYAYGITSVTDDNKESIPVYVTVGYK